MPFMPPIYSFRSGTLNGNIYLENTVSKQSCQILKGEFVEHLGAFFVYKVLQMEVHMKIYRDLYYVQLTSLHVHYAKQCCVKMTIRINWIYFTCCILIQESKTWHKVLRTLY